MKKPKRETEFQKTYTNYERDHLRFKTMLDIGRYFFQAGRRSAIKSQKLQKKGGV